MTSGRMGYAISRAGHAISRVGYAFEIVGFVILTVFYHYRYRRMSPEKWIREATAEQVTAGFMRLILDGDDFCLCETYSKQQLAIYHQTFDSISISKSPMEPYVDQTAFSSFLSRHFQSSYPHFVVAAPILYKIALTHAAYPFSNDPPDTLSADSLLRAVTMLTGRVQRILQCGRMVGDGYYFINPDRSEHDIRRLVFQSLAMPAAYVDLKEEKQRVNLTDDDLADIHLVASRAQPSNLPCLPLKWSDILPMAMRLSKPRVPLVDLRIPYEVLRQLLKLLLAVQTFDRPDSGTRDTRGLDKQAVALLQATGSEGDAIEFGGFETVYERLGRREGRLENELMDDFIILAWRQEMKLKPDLLQCLAKVFEVFLLPKSE